MQQYKLGDHIGGEYSVLNVFGGEKQSGMGVVYLVRHRDIPKPIVLKTLQDSENPAAKRKFLAEAHAWVTAGAHTNIVQAYWVREIAGQVFIAADYIQPDEEGRNNLTHYLSAGRLRPEITLLWATQFCLGMDYARTRGVLVHRDIKPDNLMIDRTLTLKITDFGLAKSTDSGTIPQKHKWWFFRRKQPPTTISKTMTGSAMGTLSYMAPEQFIDAKDVDHRADIYSFGIVLYQMVSGSYPYKLGAEIRDVATEFFRAHSEQTPSPLSSPLMPIISRCLEKVPGRRYATYSDLLRDLNAVATEQNIKLPEVVEVAKEDEELYAQAQSFVTLGDKGRALEAIDEYVSKYPENECGWTEKGRIHFERGEYEKALVATRQSVVLNPYNTHAWNNLGLLLNQMKAPIAEVRVAFDNALRLDPYNTAAMINFAGPLAIHKEYREAAILSARALMLRPEKPTVLQNAQALLREFLANKHYESAEALLDGWTEAKPTDATAWHNRALILLDKHDLDGAIQCFKKVHELSPEDNFAVTQLAKLYFQMKKGPECLDHCNKLIRRGHELNLAVSLKARTLNYMGRREQALEFLQNYLDHSPENDMLWVVLAEIREYCQEYDSAIEALRVAKGLLERSKSVHSRENLEFVTGKLEQLLALR